MKARQNLPVLTASNLTDVSQCQHFYFLECFGDQTSRAPLFGFHWQAADPGGMNSVAWYQSWLLGRNDDLGKEFVEYNLDDVRAMEAVYLGLKNLRPK